MADLKKIKKLCAENTRSLLIRFLFTNFTAKPTQQSLYNNVAHYSGNHSDGIDLGTEMWIFK